MQNIEKLIEKCKQIMPMAEVTVSFFLSNFDFVANFQSLFEICDFFFVLPISIVRMFCFLAILFFASAKFDSHD